MLGLHDAFFIKHMQYITPIHDAISVFSKAPGVLFTGQSALEMHLNDCVTL